MTDLSKTVTIGAHNITFIKARGNFVEVTLRMTHKEFEKDIWSNKAVRMWLPYCEFQKCTTKDCDGQYVIIANKDEFGRECFECSNPYCDECYKDNMVKCDDEWNCKKH